MIRKGFSRGVESLKTAGFRIGCACLLIEKATKKPCARVGLIGAAVAVSTGG